MEAYAAPPGSPRTQVRILRELIADIVLHQDLEASHPNPDEIPDDEDDELPEGIIEDDYIVRCTACAWEVVDGFCQSCLLEHAQASDDEDSTELGRFMSVSTDNAMLISERQLTPRGSTPLLSIDPASIPYAARTETRLALLARGATHTMCDVFRLEYSAAAGIVAWADQELFDEFSGPGMLRGDCWRICLGRSVRLEADDPDGRTFIEELVEETMLFPSTARDEVGRWETVLEEGRVWVTRPAMGPADLDEDLDDADSDDADSWMDGYESDRQEKVDAALEVSREDNQRKRTEAVFRDEYEDSDAEEQGGMDVDPDSRVYQPDRAWSPGSDLAVSDAGLDDDLEADTLSQAHAISVKSDDLGAGPHMHDADEESVDSDFNEEEELSGDEGLMAYTTALLGDWPQAPVFKMQSS